MNELKLGRFSNKEVMRVQILYVDKGQDVKDIAAELSRSEEAVQNVIDSRKFVQGKKRAFPKKNKSKKITIKDLMPSKKGTAIMTEAASMKADDSRSKYTKPNRDDCIHIINDN